MTRNEEVATSGWIDCECVVKNEKSRSRLVLVVLVGFLGFCLWWLIFLQEVYFRVAVEIPQDGPSALNKAPLYDHLRLLVGSSRVSAENPRVSMRRRDRLPVVSMVLQDVEARWMRWKSLLSRGFFCVVEDATVAYFVPAIMFLLALTGDRGRHR